MLRKMGRPWRTGYGSMRGSRSTRCLVGSGCVACMEVERAIRLWGLVALTLEELIPKSSTCWGTNAMQTVDLICQFERRVTVEDFIAHSPEDGAGQPSIRATSVRSTLTHASKLFCQVLQAGLLTQGVDYSRGGRTETVLRRKSTLSMS